MEIKRFTTVEELSWGFVDPKEEMPARVELEKVVLSCSGGWCTVAYLARDLNRDKPDERYYNPPKAYLVRYRKREGVWKKASDFRIAPRQMRQIAEILKGWSETVAYGGYEDPQLPSAPAGPPSASATSEPSASSPAAPSSSSETGASTDSPESASSPASKTT